MVVFNMDRWSSWGHSFGCDRCPYFVGHAVNRSVNSILGRFPTRLTGRPEILWSMRPTGS